MSSPSRAASLTSVVVRSDLLPNKEINCEQIRAPSLASRQHVKQQLVSHLSRLERVTASPPPTALIDRSPEKELDKLLQNYCYESRDAHVLAHASDIRAWSRALLNLVPDELSSAPCHMTVAEKIDIYTRATELACQILKLDQGILYSE